MPSLRRRFTYSIHLLVFALPLAVFFASATLGETAAVAQTSQGDESLDEAFSLKLAAKSTRDLDKVVDLCEQAIEDGLDEEGVEQAKQLAAAALYEHAEQVSRPVLAPTGRDRRWQLFRRQALKRLKKATEYQPKMGSAWLLITRLHGLPGGDTEAAAEAVEKAIELAGDDRRQLSAALFLRAKLAGQSGDEETLLADLDQAIKINPDNVDAYRLRGGYYLRKREPNKALEDLKRWLASSENTLESIKVVDLLIAMDDKFDESLQASAVEILDRAIEKDPENWTPLYARARIRTLQKDIDGAIADTDEAIKLDPDNQDLIRFRVGLLIDGKRWEEATAAIDKVLTKNPNDVAMIQLRMSLLIDQSDYAGAIEQLRKLIRLAPENLALRRQLAALYNADDRPTQAIRVYSRLLESDRVSAEGLDEASEQRQLEVLSLRSGLLQGRGNARLSTGEHKEAISDYDEALDLCYRLRDVLEELGVDVPSDGGDPTLVGVLNNFAWVLATSPDDELRDGKRAIELATEAAELTKFKEAYILSTLASGYAESADFDQALKWIEKAIVANAQKAEELEKAGEDQEAARLNEEQTESLQKEKASYVAKQPWRERQDVEAENEATESADDSGKQEKPVDPEATAAPESTDEPGGNQDDSSDSDEAPSANDDAEPQPAPPENEDSQNDGSVPGEGDSDRGALDPQEPGSEEIPEVDEEPNKV